MQDNDAEKAKNNIRQNPPQNCKPCIVLKQLMVILFDTFLQESMKWDLAMTKEDLNFSKNKQSNTRKEEEDE